MKIGNRLTRLMKEQGYTQESLSKVIGVSHQAVQQWMTDKTTPRSKRVDQLARTLGVSPEELLFGKKTENVLHQKTSEVPLISWIQAGSFTEAIDLYHTGDYEMTVLCPVNHGPSTYALRVEGDSMTATHGKSYPSGCIIYVDPGQGVVSGDRVIAKLQGSHEVTFKQYIDEAGKKFLRPLNTSYPLITDAFRILGKVIGKFESD